MRRLVVLLAVLSVFGATVLVPTGARAQAATIHPGDYMASSQGACTLGFAAHRGSEVFFMTAAHCVAGVGEDIRLLDGSVFGDVAVIGDDGSAATDWALVRVRSAHVPRVRGDVRGHPTSPTGVATANQVSPLELIRFSGYGVPFDLLALTREQRVGVLVSQSANAYTAVGLDIFGDSGGPVFSAATGRAIGLVSRLCIGVCTSEGPTVQGVLAQAAARGFGVALRRA